MIGNAVGVLTLIKVIMWLLHSNRVTFQPLERYLILRRKGTKKKKEKKRKK